MKVKFSRCNSSDLSSLTITDGQLIFVKDTNENYIDVGTSRNKISDVVFVSDEDELEAITTPLQNKLYFVESTNDLRIYNGSSFDSLFDLASTTSNGLMSSTDKTKLDGIAEGATAVSPSTTTPIVAGTAAIGTDSGYARGDHIHPAQTSVSGNAGTATKLATSRTIGISGAVTGTATSFNGSANITIPTTYLDASYLTGTASIDTTGNAATATTATSATSATTATKIGSTTVGSTSTPVYIATGTPTEVTSLDATLLSGTASINTTGNASTATKLATARTISLTGDVTGSTTFDGSANKSITTTLADLDASKITTGTLDIARLPAAALERCVVVDDDTARYALTTDDVQLGDTVKVTGTAIMYMVTDTDNLDNDDGYTEYAAGTASVALSCTGNSATATQLATARTINGTSFNGTANITTAQWGTARNISIADSTSANTGSAVSVNGSAAVTLKLPATIAADITGNASTATSATSATTATTATTATQVSATAATTTKAYVLGVTESGTTPLYDTGVYLDTTAGRLHATTFNGYTLAAACAKAVDTSISSTTSTNVPTSKAVVDYITSLDLEDTNYYPTTWTWSSGTTSGPTATLTGEGMDSVSVAAIPSADGTTQSGIVTTGAQTFGGVKTFSSAPKLSTNTLTTSSGYTITIPNTASATLATLATSQSLTNKTYNGYTLADACAKAVDTSIDSTTSTNLPTSAAVVAYVDDAVASISCVTTQATSLTCTLPDDL